MGIQLERCSRAEGAEVGREAAKRGLMDVLGQMAGVLGVTGETAR